MTEVFCNNTTVAEASGGNGKRIGGGNRGHRQIQGVGGTVLCSESPKHELGGTLSTHSARTHEQNIEVDFIELLRKEAPVPCISAPGTQREMPSVSSLTPTKCIRYLAYIVGTHLGIVPEEYVLGCSNYNRSTAGNKYEVVIKGLGRIFPLNASNYY